MLALTISAEDKTGNGVHLYDARQARTASSIRRHRSTAGWPGAAMPTISSCCARRPMTRAKDRRMSALAWNGVGRQHTAKPRHSIRRRENVPAGMRTVSFRRPSWSDDGRRCSSASRPWEAKAVDARNQGQAADHRGDPGCAGVRAAAEETADSRHLAREGRRRHAAPEAQRAPIASATCSPPGTWTAGRLVQLGKEVARTGRPDPPARRSRTPPTWERYAMERTIGRTAADISLVEHRDRRANEGRRADR